MSVLLHAEIDGERLTQMQLSVFFMLLQNAGSETTRNLITTGMLSLLERPEQLAALRDDPELLPVAIEELLRHATPVMSFTRVATTDTEVGGQADRRGRPRADGLRVGEPRRARVRRPRRRSTSAATPTTTSRSAPAARTSAWARTWRGSRARLMFEAILTRFEGLEIDGRSGVAPPGQLQPHRRTRRDARPVERPVR